MSYCYLNWLLIPLWCFSLVATSLYNTCCWLNWLCINNFHHTLMIYKDFIILHLVYILFILLWKCLVVLPEVGPLRAETFQSSTVLIKWCECYMWALVGLHMKETSTVPKNVTACAFTWAAWTPIKLRDWLLKETKSAIDSELKFTFETRR